jgi:hypothetical protein
MSLAFAIGLGRGLAATGSGGDRAAGGGSAGRAAGGSGPDRAAGRRGARWAAVLAGAYGVGLVLAGIFRADPAYGFPVGTPAGPGSVSWHGMLHLGSAAIGFGGLIAACFVVASRLGGRGWAWYSRATGVAFAAGFVGVATGSGYAAVTIAFTLAVVAAWAWMAAVSVHLYRQTH